MNMWQRMAAVLWLTSFVGAAAAQEFFVRGPLNEFGKTPMTLSGASQYDKTLRAFEPLRPWRFFVESASGLRFPLTDVRGLTDHMGNLNVSYQAGPFADGYQPVADRVGFSDPGQDWEIIGQGFDWPDFTSNPRGRMTHQGSGVYAVELNFAVATVLNFRFRPIVGQIQDPNDPGNPINPDTLSVGEWFSALAPNINRTVQPGRIRFEIDLPRGRWRVVSSPLTGVRFVNRNALGPTADGLTWDTAFRELAVALNTIGANPAITQVWVAAGTYRPTGAGGANRGLTFNMRSNLSVLGGFAGGELSEPLRRPRANVTTLSGDLNGDDLDATNPDGDWLGQTVAPPWLDDNSFRVVTFVNVAATGALRGFVVRGGAARDGDPIQNGGGIIISGGAPRVSECVITRNWAAVGGGIDIGSSASPSIQNCSVAGNMGEFGGGGVRVLSGTPVIINTIFARNLCSEGGARGGGVLTEGGTTTSMTNCTFVGNAITGFNLGGGIFANANHSLANCILWGNTAFGVGGLAAQRSGAPPVIAFTTTEGDAGPPNGNNGLDPQFVNPAGPDGTLGTIDDDLRVVDSSQMIDTANRDADTNLALAGVQQLDTVVTVDLDGTSRFVDPQALGGLAAVDRGAYEYRAVFYVDNLNVAAGSGRAWGNAFNTLDEALFAIDGLTLPGPREIWIAGSIVPHVPNFALNPGDFRSRTYVMRDRLSIRGGFEAYETAIGQRDPGRVATQLSGDLLQNDQPGGLNRFDNSYHVVAIATPVSGAALDGLLITSGNADGSSPLPFSDRGGGVLLVEGGVDIVRSHVRECSSLNEGGGIYAATQTTLSLDSTGVSLCTATSGGAIRAENELLVANDCGFRENAAFNGGAVRFESSAQLSEVDFFENAAGRGAALACPALLDLTLTQAVFERNLGTTGSGAIDIAAPSAGTPVTLSDVWMSGNSNGGTTFPANGSIRFCNVALGPGSLRLQDGVLELRTTEVIGQGSLVLDEGATLRVGNVSRSRARPSKVCVPITGTGTIYVAPAQTLIVNCECLDLSGSPTPCTQVLDPSFADAWGKLLVEGTVEIENASVRNTDIVVRNRVTAASCGDSVGGLLLVKSSGSVLHNRVTAYGDRYLQLTPGAVGTNTSGNHYHVIIEPDPFAATNLGEIFLARTPLGDTTDEWVLKSFRVRAGAKVNIVRRDGFDDLGDGNTVYSESVTVEPGGVLNVATGTNLVCGGPGLWAQCTGPGIVSTPLLGFSLEVIKMEDDCEYEVRIDPRDTDINNVAGSIQRIDVPAHGGVMEMRTLSATSVAAKGTFAPSGEDKVVVTFRYKFTEVSAGTRLDVYLSNSPYVGEQNNLLARVVEPPAGKPGSRTSSKFGWFFGRFPRNQLELDVGSYVEIVLNGANSSIYIDDFDPYISCESLQCGDISLSGTFDHEDYLAALTSFGESFAPVNDALQFDKDCYDKFGVRDRYSDANDIVGRDAALTQEPGGEIDPCEIADYAPSAGEARTLPTDTSYVIAGHPYESDLSADNRLYAYSSANSLSATLLAPGPAIDATIIGGRRRGYGRLIERPSDGAVIQLHATYGLIDVEAGTLLYTPPSAPLAYPPSGPAIASVYVGPRAVSGATQGEPLTDAVFDPTDPDTVYVAPVWVVPVVGSPYSATAALNISTSTPTITQLYGPTPNDVGNTIELVELGGEIVYAPDKYRPREIEIDMFGNLLVSSSQAMNGEHYIMAFNTNVASQQPVYTLDLTTITPANVCYPLAALLWSQVSPSTLMFACANNTDSMSTRVYRYNVTRNGSNVVTAIAYSSQVTITQPDLGAAEGQKTHIVSMAENSTGTVRAVGMVAPAYTDVSSLPSDSFAIPTTAIVPSSGSVAATQIVGIGAFRLAMPVSILFVPVGCPEDLNSDGVVNLTDLAILLANFGRVGGVTQAMGDINNDGRIDLTDLALLLAKFGVSC
ncbi:MAG: right-handed parallel beta-helix repeat-containing protein [Phycisphaerae bacterium]